MLDISPKEYQIILKKLLAYAKKHLSPKKLLLMKPFIEQYYAQAPIDELKARSTHDLFGAMLSHWQLMEERAPEEYKRQIFNPELDKDGWQTSHTVLQFILEDQPFLVDSLRNAIHRKGLSVHFSIHLGGIHIVRNKQHKIVKILPFDSAEEKSCKEAPIYFEVDRQTNPQVLQELSNELDQVIHDARVVVSDWEKMVTEVQVVLAEMEAIRPPIPAEELNEVKAFLQWLISNHFTFLGYRQYDVTGSGESRALKLVPGSGLGVLHDTTQSRNERFYAELPPEARKIAMSKQQVIILAKTNTRSTVHGNRYTDYVSVKRFNAAGEIIGERWFVGLYTSTVYTESAKSIPIVRLKVADILQRSGLPKNGHSYKTLEHILVTLPRDELFHASVEELFHLSIGILQLQDRHCIRLFFRKDIFNRFISCLVYVPRDDFSIELVNRMQEILLNSFHGLEISYTTLFSDSILARLHFTIRIDPHKAHRFDGKNIEKKLIEVGRSWKDALHEQLVKQLGEEQGNALMMRYGRAFSVGYQEMFSPAQTVHDVEHIERLLSNHGDLETNLYRPGGAAENMLHFKLFHLQGTVPLSDAIPILEKMGLRVIGEQPYKIPIKSRQYVWINDFNMSYPHAEAIHIEEIRCIFQEAFTQIWNGAAEHDGFNALVLAAHLSWREVAVLRAYAKYLKQIGFTFSQDYMEATLWRNASVSKLMVQLFYLRFDPAQRQESAAQALEEKIKQALDAVVNLDEDRILRMYLNLIKATVRTNYFQTDEHGHVKPYISFKFNPMEIQDLPLPYPKHEIFVYSPRFEGVHLRAGKVARGGIRWSDRREDFRQEVLGLMKAQQVKNAVIVPAGAKGGFITKLLTPDASREEAMKEGISCYQGFIRGLLDLTDNFVGNAVVRPENTVCYDDEDTYLVVAADKGTATFSDIANRISQHYHYWLRDAFASGGSTGYDHKKIGITARGAWESVKWHFQELEMDIEKQPFTVIGIGDMSGDVFGNGMLQSRMIKLVAAFNGSHIFIDPNPDPKRSFEERERLFKLSRSTWEDYNPELISAGGGVFRKSLKSIKLSAEVKNLLGSKKEQMTPNDLIQAILKAPVDLLWNGGIGTFVKSQVESNQDVSDRSNDAIRINGDELLCKVVGEGGNLGLTQLARIEYQLSGGRINTDFIDNSGGVDCSDHEVNLKILLNNIVMHGEMTEKQRNVLLAKMTDEVAALVLHNNFRQVRAISIAVRESYYYLSLYESFLRDNARQGRIDVKLEFLPDETVFIARKAAGKGLTRPEIAVLLAYSKIILKAEIIDSRLPEDPYLNRYIQYAFPTLVRQRYLSEMEQHRLRREILATQLSNWLVTDMGITFVYQMADEVRTSTADIVSAYIIAREIFDLGSYWEAIESLNIPVDMQMKMTLQVVRLIRRTVRWILRNQHGGINVSATIDYFKDIKKLDKHLSHLLVGTEKAHFETQRDTWVEAGVPVAIASKIALAPALYSALNIIKLSTEQNANVLRVAKVYFLLTARLYLDEFSDMINNYPLESHWMVLARSAVKGDLDWQQRFLTLSVMQLNPKATDPVKNLKLWLEKKKHLIERWESLFAEMKASSSFEYATLMVAMRELLDLARN